MRSPGWMPYFLAVPATTSSTPFAGPPDEMILVDSGSVFSAIRKIRPSGRMKIMSRETYVFFIHIETSCAGEKSNSMPFPSASSFRYIRPVVFSSSVVASSTENTCTPDFVTISSGPTLAARALDPANAHIATTATAICNNRRPGERDNLTARSKFIAIAYPVAEDFCKEICAEPSILGSGGHILQQVRRICGDEHRAAALGGHDRKLPDRPVGRRSLARRRAVREHRFNQLVRQQSRRAVFRLDFRGHHALGTGPEPNEHVL